MAYSRILSSDSFSLFNVFSLWSHQFQAMYKYPINSPIFKKQTKNSQILYPFLSMAAIVLLCFVLGQNSWISCLHISNFSCSLLNPLQSGSRTSILINLREFSLILNHSSYLNQQQHLTQMITPSFLRHFLNLAFRTHTLMVFYPIPHLYLFSDLCCFLYLIPIL